MFTEFKVTATGQCTPPPEPDPDATVVDLDQAAVRAVESAESRLQAEAELAVPDPDPETGTAAAVLRAMRRMDWPVLTEAQVSTATLPQVQLWGKDATPDPLPEARP